MRAGGSKSSKKKKCRDQLFCGSLKVLLERVIDPWNGQPRGNSRGHGTGRGMRGGKMLNAVKSRLDRLTVSY